jgi:tetratricopeptide (TPR) repeat protein
MAALLLLTLLASTHVAYAGSQKACVNGGQQNPDIAAGRAVLQRSPTLLGKRLELATSLQKAGCYDQAVHVLEEGQKYNPYSPILSFGLRRARNLVKEQHYLEGFDQAEASARRNRNMKRCTDGDGDAALQACKSVLVKGAPDEFEITMRIALLQQSTQRKDAIALAARGSSLVTLNRAREALAPLRQAKALEPGLPDIDRQLKAAEALARSESVPKERPTQVAAINAEAEAMVVPQTYSNGAEATRSN